MSVDSNWLIQQFHQMFERHSDDEVWVARAPGRVNLIGEHTDYSGGFVLPVAVEHDVAIAFRVRTDRTVRLYSCDYREMTQFCLDEIRPSAKASWSNYFRGVAWVLSNYEGQGEREYGDNDEGEGAGKDWYEWVSTGLERHLELCGLDGVISGNVPIGAGLSSSAAFEVASAIALLVAAGMDTGVLDSFEPECGLKVRLGIALACQQGENLFVGVNCGIMDQIASCMGLADHAVYLDCRSLEHRPVRLGLDCAQMSIVVYDTGVRRGLVDSEYNRRRNETETGAKMIADALQRRDIHSLRDIDIATFERLRGMLPSKVASRCEHVLRENLRVQHGVAALMRGDLLAFGDLMWESHESLKDLYEVSCPELDMAVEIARDIPGVLGARMTGAGFGGCTVNLVHQEFLSELIDALPSSPMRPGALQPQAFVINVADGAGAEGPKK